MRGGRGAETIGSGGGGGGRPDSWVTFQRL